MKLKKNDNLNYFSKNSPFLVAFSNCFHLPCQADRALRPAGFQWVTVSIGHCGV